MDIFSNILHSKVEYQEIKPRPLEPQKGVAYIIADLTAYVHFDEDPNGKKERMRKATSDIEEWGKKGGHLER